jgi:RNA polymerase sigma-70 factor, ECF subfamily
MVRLRNEENIMASIFQGTLSGFVTAAPAASAQLRYDAIYQENCHRIYSLAFWMTGNELTAEQLSANTFLRAFVASQQPASDQVDRAFLREVRELMPVGTLTLNCTVSSETESVYGNIKRIHLEQAVLQLPPTEKLIFLLHDVEGYQPSKISSLLGMTEEESRRGLHQARMQVRTLISQML